jgi:multicomponent Na+:H+ antiporter subunit E
VSDNTGRAHHVPPGRIIKTVLLFVVCFALWLVLSGHWDPMHLILGLGASGLIAWLNRDEEAVSGFVRALPRLARYVPWLLVEIVRANLAVVRIVLDPRLPLDPVVVRFRLPVRGDLAVATLANSITLTPGTITLDVDGDEMIVHALTPVPLADLEVTFGGRVARVFGEDGGPA